MTFLGLRLYQFVVISLSAYMIALGVYHYLTGQQRQTLLKLALRFIVWGGMVMVALFPALTNYLARFVGLEGNINAVILTGFLLVFLMVFKILAVVERLEYEISELTRRRSLEQLRPPAHRDHP